MKVIKRLISDDIKIFKIILNSKIVVEDYMIPNIRKFINNDVKDYDKFSEQIKYIYDLDSDYIKNIKNIKSAISYQIGEITIEYSLANNILNDDIKKIILSNIKLIGDYSEKSDLLLEDAVPIILESELIYYQRDFTYTNGLIKFLNAYYNYIQKKYKDNYKEKFSIFNKQIIFLSKLNRINDFYHFLSIIKNEDLPEKEFNEYINKKSLNDGYLNYYLNDFIKNIYKEKGFNEDEIKIKIKDSLFNGNNKFIINRMIKEKASRGLNILATAYLKERLPSQLEDIISLSVESLSEYISAQTEKDQDEIINKYLYRFSESPSVTFAELKKRSYFFNIKNGSIKRNIILISPKYAYYYYADILNSNWDNESYKNPQLLIDLLENKISGSIEYSLTYFKSRIHYEKKQNKKLNVKNFIESGNYKKITETILSSTDPKILYDYAKTTKIKLSPIDEEKIKKNTNIYNDYLKINFIK
jgi:hypothetical protein